MTLMDKSIQNGFVTLVMKKEKQNTDQEIVQPAAQLTTEEEFINAAIPAKIFESKERKNHLTWK